MAIIDVHTHAYTREYLALLRARGGAYDGICYSPEALNYLISIVGVDRVLYGTDYPHQVHDMAGMLAKTEAMAPDRRSAIREGNARRLFKV